MAITKVSRGLLDTGVSDSSDATAITIDSSERVGIGTSSPSFKLDVNGSLSSNGNENVMRIAGSDTNNAGGITINNVFGASASARVSTLFSIDGQDQASPLAFGNGTTEAMRIASDGKVGINTTSPDRLLHVKGSSTSTVAKFANTGNTVYIELNAADQAGGDAGYIGYNNTKDMLFWTDDTERMRIDGSGNVGIRTTSLNAVLTTDPESGNFSSAYNNYDGVGLFIRGNGTAGDGNYGPALVFGSCDSDTVNQDNKHCAISIVQTGTDANETGLAFWTHPSATSTDALSESMRIDSSGKVGIGTTSPGYIFHVNDSASGGTSFQFQGNGPNLYTAMTNTSATSFIGVNGTQWEFYCGGTLKFQINTTNGGQTVSDQKFKKDIEDISYGLDTVKALQPRKFKWKENDESTIGFIAQEVKPVISEIITEPLESPAGLENGMTLNYSALTAVLTKAIQEQQVIIDDLKARIEALEA